MSQVAECVEYGLEDPPDVVASPQMPAPGSGSEYLRFFATKEDNFIPVKLECSFWGEVELRGSLCTNVAEDIQGWLEYNSFWDRDDAANAMRQTTLNLTRANYTTRVTRGRLARPRYQAVYEAELEIFDSLQVSCVERVTRLVLHEWSIRAHDAGPLKTGPAYLKLVQERLRQPGSRGRGPSFSFQRPVNQTRAPIFQCYSGEYTDAKLQLIRCLDPDHCRRLEACLVSPNMCGNAVSLGTECLVETGGTISCEEAQIPSPGALLHCSAGGFSYTQLRWLDLAGTESFIYRRRDRHPEDLEAIQMSRDVIRIQEPPAVDDTVAGFTDSFYTGMSYKFSCRVHSFWASGAPLFFFGFRDNETWFEQAGGGVGFGVGSGAGYVYEDIVFPSSSVTRIHCVAPLLNSETGWLGDSVSVHVIDSLKPEILNDDTELHFTDDGSSKTIQCEVGGRPLPTVSWTLRTPDGDEDIDPDIPAISGTQVYVVDGTILKFDNFTAEFEGVYTCTAKNPLGNASMDFKVTLLPKPEPIKAGSGGLWIGVGLTAAGFVILLIPALIYLRHYLLERQRVLDKLEMDAFRNGTNGYVPLNPHALRDSSSRESCSGESIELNDLGHAETKPFNAQFEIKRSSFTIYKNRKLGEGVYGKVYAGSLRQREAARDVTVDIAIAIKVPHRNCPPEILKGLLKELKIMTCLQHENVVSLLGACTTRAEYGKLYILIEFCEEGSIEQFLGRNNHGFVDHATRTVADIPIFGVPELLRWSEEVAAGMEFLATKGVVHRDLAARNVLLTGAPAPSWRAKVSDFGLPRQLYGRPTYEQQETGAAVLLPIRWMALECFMGTYSTQSDVWAYGIFVWELFSLGELPYTSVQFEEGHHFFEMLERGLRISQPHYATPEIFAKLQECWLEDASKRPSFTELKHFFAGLRAQT